MITWADVSNLDASLASVPVETQDALIADAYVILSTKRWGSKLDMAAKYLCAHVAELGRRSGAAGAVTGERLGDASVTYAMPTSLAGSALGGTAWGQMVVFLTRGLGTTVVL